MRKCLWMKVLIIGMTTLFISVSIVQARFGKKLLPDEPSVYNELSPNETLVDDNLDQNNSDWRGEGYGGPDGYMAQSFKPTLDMLTKVELLVWNQGNPQGHFTVSIRENLPGIDFTKITIGVEDLPQSAIWTEFDFPDIFIETEQTYYIVCSYDLQIYPYLDSTLWGVTGDNYLRGEYWFWYNQQWHSNEEHDFCFKTYGYNQTGVIGVFGFVSFDAIIKEKYTYENDSIYLCTPVETVTVIGFSIIFPQDYRAHFYMKTYTNVSELIFVTSKNYELLDEYQHISLFVTLRNNLCAFTFE